MTLNAAMKNLKHQKEFLGLSWEKLFSLLNEKPTIFPRGAVEAFEVYKEEISK